MAPCFYLPYLFAGLCAITLAATVPGTIAQPRDAKLPYDSLNDNMYAGLNIVPTNRANKGKRSRGRRIISASQWTAVGIVSSEQHQ